MKHAEKIWLEEIVDFLRGLESGNTPSCITSGLCATLDHKFDIRIDTQIPLSWYKQWPHYSGNKQYPIPRSINTSITAAKRWREAGLMYWVFPLNQRWGDNEYGDLRRDFCGHIADYFEELKEKLL